ncbi:MAG: DUF896 domain-containing protein [Oscillospiraceae bacterium]|nr:DUF896 domain-containing protein [Oscillospiraceae bacterium]
MEKEKLERIGHLSRKERTIGLNEEEKQEQAALRQEYLSAVRKSLTNTLENTYIVDEKGNRHKVARHS